MAAIDDLLHTGTTSRLTQQIPAELRGEEDEATKQAARAELLTRRETEEARLKELILPLKAAGTARGDTVEPPLVSEREREAEDILTRGFISAPEEQPAVCGPNDCPGSLEVAAPIPRIRIRLLKADIQDVGQPVLTARSQSTPLPWGITSASSQLRLRRHWTRQSAQAVWQSRGDQLATRG